MPDREVLARPFERMGARLKLRERTPTPAGRRYGILLRVRVNEEAGAAVRVDVGRDRAGEFFDVLIRPGVELKVLDVRPKERHLLLLADDRGEKSRFLCGHDERAWFVAAIPEESKAVTSVSKAKEALKPEVVRAAEQAIPYKYRDRRRNRARVRQGEWFFIPAPSLVADPKLVLKHEPIRRGRGKPHICEELYRTGGVEVYVNTEHPNGLTQVEYDRLVREDPEKNRMGWRKMQRDAQVYVRGQVRHSDHKTIGLRGWHRVEMNLETRARAMQHVAFLD